MAHCGESILDKYQVKLLSAAYLSLEDIYTCISEELHEKQSALKLIDQLEEAILSLELMPYRGAKRRAGAYAKKGYRQIFIKNFTIVYRIDKSQKEVIIVTVRYSGSEF